MQKPASRMTGQTLIAFEHLVRVRQTEFAAAHGIHPDAGVLQYFRVTQQLAGNKRKVACRGQRLLTFAVQSVGVDERCVRAAEFACARVHPFDKGGLCARQMLRYRNRTVIR